MRKTIKYWFVLPLALALLFGCEEDKDLVKMKKSEEVNTPVITAPSNATSILLSRDNSSDVALSVFWNEPDYGVDVEIDYSVELDLAGGDFSDPLSLGIVNVDSFTISHALLNQKLLEFGLDAESQTELNLRIVSEVNYQLPEKISEVTSIFVTPYSTVFPSIYMIGAAVGGWDPALAVEVASTGEANKYSTIAYFDNASGDNFRFFTAPDWGSSLGGYDVFTNYPAEYLGEKAGDGDPNFQFLGAPGWYEISVDRTTGSIEMKAASEPLLYLTGDATHGWGWDDPVTSLDWVGHQIWEGEVTFTKDGFFRLFEQKDWGPVGYGYDLITHYDTSIIIIAVGHGDPNWQFIADSGTYLVHVDKREATIEITPK